MLTTCTPPILSLTISGGYFRAGSDLSTYVIFLEGGGACYTAADCAARAKTPLGSSLQWPDTKTDDDNILSADPAINPVLANASHLFIPYCGGDVHAGQRTERASADVPFYFSGHFTVREAVLMLIRDTGIAHARTVVLAGSSAGGIGTFLNAQPVRALLPGVADFRIAPQGGFFFPAVVPWAAWEANALGPPYATILPSAVALWHPALPPACVAAHGVEACGTLVVSYPFAVVDAAGRPIPVHVGENLMDSNQVFAQLLAPSAMPLPPRVLAFVDYFRSKMVDGLQQVVAAAGDATADVAMWAPACLIHTENLNLVSKTLCGSHTYGASLNAWLLRDHATVPRVLIDSASSNPSCPLPAVDAASMGGKSLAVSLD